MKSRRLTETDIAKLAFRPAEMKRFQLTSLERPKKIIGSYEPFRNHNGDAVNEQYRLLGDRQPETSLDALEAVISKACKGDPDLLAMNLPIARATHEFAKANGIVAQREDVRRLTLPFGHKYEFGMPLLMAYPDGRVAAVFPDLRRTQHLSATAQRVVFSMMHHRWREGYPDLAELDLEIWRYANDSARTVCPIRVIESQLFDYDSLMADVRETYDIWHNVLEAAAATRRGGTSDAGPLFASKKS